jgi:hypothetical protein
MERIQYWRKKLKLDKVELTYRSLVRMSVYILSTFLLLSILVSRFFPANSPERFMLRIMKVEKNSLLST